MKLKWTHQAFGDRDAIMDHIAKDNVPAALAIDERITGAVENLLPFPEMGRVGRVTGTQELVVAKTACSYSRTRRAQCRKILVEAGCDFSELARI
jgi:toxin ParE1/3/4